MKAIRPLDTDTRIVRPHELAANVLAERIALFALVSRHPRALAVLEGLSRPAASAGTKLLDSAAGWSSSKRQARATLEFGHRGDQHERLAELLTGAYHDLKLAMFAQMTPQQQARFPKLLGLQGRALPARTAFAARLVREACR
jgi:hypothetical protein